MKPVKTYYFISGLPRSGSTLLCNLLVQNPDFYSSATSSLLSLLLSVRDRVSDIPSLKALNDKKLTQRVLKGMFEGYFSNTDRSICFDKSRGWCHHIEMAEEIIGGPIKILVTVRDVREVLASFEKLWRDNSGHRSIPQEKLGYHQFNSIEGRLAMWMKEDQVVGASYNNIRDAIQRGFSDRLLFVDFDTMTTYPEESMNKIYKFLDLPNFKHDFNNVEQVIHEKDEYYGFDDLHTIRPKIEPVVKKWPILIGEHAAQRYGGMNFWMDPEIQKRESLNTTFIKNT